MNYTYNNSFIDKTLIPKPNITFGGYFNNTQFQPTQALSSDILLNTSQQNLNNPMNWYRSPSEAVETSAGEARILEQEVAVLSNAVLNNAISVGGVDPSKGILLRQLMGSPAFKEIAVPRNQISNESILVKENNYNQLVTEVTEEELKNPEVVNTIKQEHNELTYMKYVMKTPDLSTGFDYPTYVRSSGGLGGDILALVSDAFMGYNFHSFNLYNPNTIRFSEGVLNMFGASLAEKTDEMTPEGYDVPGDLKDIERIITREDNNFNPERWYQDELTKNPVVAQGLLDMGIDKDYFFGVPNKEAALFKLGSRLNITTIHNKLQSYNPGTSWISPRWYVRQAANLKDAFVNNIDTPLLIGADVLVTTAASVIGGSMVGTPVVGVVAGAANVAVKASRAWTILKGTGSTAWHLGFGGLPTYARSWSLIRPTAWHFGQGAAFMTASNIAAQENNIAFANSVYSINPEMTTSINTEEVIHSAIFGGLFASSFNLAHGALAEGLGRLTGKIDTPIAKTLYNIRKARGLTTVADVDSITNLVHEAVNANKVPTVEEANAKLREQAEARETTNGIQTNTTETAPYHPLSRRLKDESIDSFSLRTASSQSLEHHMLLLDAVSEGGRFSELSHGDKTKAIGEAKILASTIEKQELFILNAKGVLDPTVAKAEPRTQFHLDIQKNLDSELVTVTKRLEAENITNVGKEANAKAQAALDKADELSNNPEEAVPASTPKLADEPAPPKTEPVITEATTTEPVVPEASVKPPEQVTPEKEAAIVKAIAEEQQLTPDSVKKTPEHRLSLLTRINQLFEGNDNHGTIKKIAIARAKGRKLSVKQKANIIAVLEQPSLFKQDGVVKGNRIAIENFYDRIMGLKEKGYINEENAILILAATVNLRFNRNLHISARKGGSSVSIAEAQVKLGDDLTLNYLDNLDPAATVLHEIGHVYELYASGESLYSMRKLFKDMEKLKRDAKEVVTRSKEVDYLSGSTQELFAEAFSTMLISEVHYVGFLKNLKENRGLFQAKMLESAGAIVENLIHVFHSLKNSKAINETRIYEAVKDVIHRVEKSSQYQMRRYNYIRNVTSSLFIPIETELKGSGQTPLSIKTKILNDSIRSIFEEDQNFDAIFMGLGKWIKTTDEGLAKYLFTEKEVEFLLELTKFDDVENIIETFLMTKESVNPMLEPELFYTTFKQNHETTATYITSIVDNYVETGMKNAKELYSNNPGFKDKPIEVQIRDIIQNPESQTFQQPKLDQTVSTEIALEYAIGKIDSIKNKVSELITPEELGAVKHLTSEKNLEEFRFEHMDAKKEMSQIAASEEDIRIARDDIVFKINGIKNKKITIKEIREALSPFDMQLLLTTPNAYTYFKDNIHIEPEALVSILEGTYKGFEKRFRSYPWTGNNHYTIQGNRIFDTAYKTARSIISDTSLDPTMRQTLKVLVDNHADLLKNTEMLILTPDKFSPGTEGSYMRYDDYLALNPKATNGSILINRKTALTGRGRAGQAQTILHEMVHAIAVEKIDTATAMFPEPSSHSLFSEPNPVRRNEMLLEMDTLVNTMEESPAKNLAFLYQEYLKYVVEGYTTVGKIPGFAEGGPYGATNLHEFIAEAWANPLFQQELATIPSLVGSKPTNIFKNVLNTILKMVGLENLIDKLQMRGLKDTMDKDALLSFFETGDKSVLEGVLYETTRLKDYTPSSKVRIEPWEQDMASWLSSIDSVDDGTLGAPRRDVKKTQADINQEALRETTRDGNETPKLPGIKADLEAIPSLPRSTATAVRLLAGIDAKIGNRLSEENPALVTAIVNHLGTTLGLSTSIVDTLATLKTSQAVSDLLKEKLSTGLWKVSDSNGGITEAVIAKRKLTAVKRGEILKVIQNINVDVDTIKPKNAPKEFPPSGPPLTIAQAEILIGNTEAFIKKIKRKTSKIPSAIKNSSNFDDLVSSVTLSFIENPSVMLKGGADLEEFLNRFAVAVERAGIKEKNQGVVNTKTNINQTNFKDFKENLNSTLPDDKQVTMSFDEMMKSGGEMKDDFIKRYGVKKSLESSSTEDGGLTGESEAATAIDAKPVKVAASIVRGQHFSTMKDHLEARGIKATNNPLDAFVLDGLIEGKTIPMISEEAKSIFPNGSSISNIEKRRIIIKRRFISSIVTAADPDGKLGISKLPDDEILGMLATLSKEDWERISLPVETERVKMTPKQVKENKLDIQEQNEISKAIDENPANQTEELSVGVIPDSTVEPMAVMVTPYKKNRKPTGVTPQIPIGSAERMTTRNASTGKFVSVGSTKPLSLAAGSERDFFNLSFGIVDGVKHPALAEMEGILASVKFKKLSPNVIKTRIRELVLSGKTEEAVKEFIEAMAVEKIDGVQIFGVPFANGKPNIVRRFVFKTQDWNYGSHVEMESGPGPQNPTTLAPDGKTTIPVTRKLASTENKSQPVNSSEVVKTNEVDRLHRNLTEGNEGLRDNGVDASSFRRVLAMLKTAAKKAGFEMTEAIPPQFKKVWGEFVEMNARIMQFNRQRFRSETIVQSFWKEVDKIVAREDALKVSVKNKKTYMTKTEIYAEAAKNVSTPSLEFLPPIPDFSFRFTFNDKGVPTLEFFKNTEYIRNQVDNASLNLKDTPPELVTHQKANSQRPVEKAKQEDLKSDDELVESLLERSRESSSRLLRGNTFVGWLFGGSERADRNWWRAFMSGLGNSTQTASGLGGTVRNLESEMGFISTMFDDTRLMTGTLVAPNGNGIRSFTRAKAEATQSTLNFIRIVSDLQQAMNEAGLKQADVKPVEMMFLLAFQKKKLLSVLDLETAFGKGKEYGDVLRVLQDLRTEMINRNKEIFALENKTGWRSFDNFDPETYIPMQMVAAALKTLEPTQRQNLITSMVTARLKSKKLNETLDVNTLILLGILDIQTPSSFFIKGRKFVDSGETTILDNDSLKLLLVKEHDISTMSPEHRAMMLDNEHGQAGKTYFTITTGNIQRVYRNPKILKDLSLNDQTIYKNAIDGDVTNVLDKWEGELRGSSLIQREMEELIDYKMNAGRYRRDTGKLVNGRPDISPSDDPYKTVAVQNLTPDESFSSPDIINVTRTNMSSSYQMWLNSRLFDLKAQETIDQLVQHTGLRPEKALAGIERRMLTAIADNTTLTAKQKANRQANVTQGMDRLFWSYSEMNGTLPSNIGSAGNLANNAARTTRNLIALRSLAWGLSSAPETFLEIFKSARHGGLSVPVDILRYTGSMLKFWDRSNPSLRYAIDDLCTSLEDFSDSHATHMVDGMLDVDLDITGITHRSIWGKENNTVGPLSTITGATDKLAKSAMLLGGLQYHTQFTRGLAKVRQLGDLSVFLFGKKRAAVEKFLALRLDPIHKTEMDSLLAASYNSAIDERRLSRKFKTLAREAGLNQMDAVKLLTVGIDSSERLKALQWGLGKLDMVGNKVDFIELNQLYYELKANKSIGIDAELFKDTVSRYQYGIENLIRKRSVSHAYGLNKPMSAFHLSEVGKLINTLTSWLRSWQDDVVLNASERGSAGLIFGGLVAASTMEVLIFTLREWIGGRDTEDIARELKERPVAYVLKVASKLPLMGAFTPIMETAIKYGIAVQSGSQRTFNAMMQSIDVGGIGASSISGIGRNIGGGIEDIFESTQMKDKSKTKYGKGAARLVQAIVPYNSSQYAIPARVLETVMDLDEKSAFMQFQDMVQRQPKPYGTSGASKLKNRGSTSSGYSVDTTMIPTPVNARKEAAQAPKDVKPVQQKPFSIKSNQGTSPLLASLLKKSRRRSQSWG